MPIDHELRSRHMLREVPSEAEDSSWARAAAVSLDAQGHTGDAFVPLRFIVNVALVADDALALQVTQVLDGFVEFVMPTTRDLAGSQLLEVSRARANSDSETVVTAAATAQLGTRGCRRRQSLGPDDVVDGAQPARGQEDGNVGAEGGMLPPAVAAATAAPGANAVVPPSTAAPRSRLRLSNRSCPISRPARPRERLLGG